MGVTGCMIVRMGVDLGIYQIFRDFGLDPVKHMRIKGSLVISSN